MEIWKKDIAVARNSARGRAFDSAFRSVDDRTPGDS